MVKKKKESCSINLYQSSLLTDTFSFCQWDKTHFIYKLYYYNPEIHIYTCICSNTSLFVMKLGTTYMY